jgi:hypothetical protein
MHGACPAAAEPPRVELMLQQLLDRQETQSAAMEARLLAIETAHTADAAAAALQPAMAPTPPSTQNRGRHAGRHLGRRTMQFGDADADADGCASDN